MLNHTIRLSDYDYRAILDKLVKEHYEPVIIMAKLNKIYFGDEGITVETMKAFGEDMCKLMNHHSCFYCITTSKYLGETIQGFKEAGLDVKNVLTIPVTNDYGKGHCIRNRTRYDENKTMYVVYSTKCCHGRQLNYTNIAGGECTCNYSANWSWFKGSEIEAYRTMMRISSEHRDEVFDPFMFNGDIGVAAIRTDRHYFGTEPDGGRFRAIKERLDCLGE